MLAVRSISIFLVSVFLVVGCAHNRPEFKGNTEAEKFSHFLEWSFNTFMDRTPEEMTEFGINKKQDQLNDRSYEHDKKTFELARRHLEILETFNEDELNGQDQVSYDIYRQELELKVEGFKWRDHRYQVNQMFGVQSQLPGFMISLHQVKSEKDLQNYLSRLGQFHQVFGQVINNLMRSETKGVVPPKFVFTKVIEDSKNIISGAPFVTSKNDSPLYRDFKKKLKSLKLSAAKQKSYKRKADQVFLTSVGPGYADLIAFLEQQKLRAKTDDGAWKHPDGAEYYKYQLKKMTTTHLGPEEIHQLGLSHVARIHEEMEKIAKTIKFKGNLQSFFKHMKSPEFLYANNARGKKKYMKQAKTYINTMKKNLDRFFVTQPKAEIVVKAVEAFREKSAGMAFYQSAKPDGSRPGTYYVNTYNMKALPTWEAEALAYHEGIPGHHMQISIAQELESIPKFRKYSVYPNNAAYVEGWGLYSEKLPKEFGFYKDPHSDFGRLSMELTRACRLVVDTGIHHKKWSKEQAIAYLDKNLPGDHDDNVRQIYRYTVWPGQATAYMVGMLKILELRDKAKQKMGQKFDIKKFHDRILTSGPMPLSTLERVVEDYIKSS